MTELKSRRVFTLPLIAAFLGAGLGTLLASVFLETFIFLPLIKTRSELSPWNRELNALSLILASIIGGAVAVKLAKSSASLSEALPAKLREMLTQFKEERSSLPIVFAAAGVATLLWVLRHVVPDNPLTVGWRGYLMNAAAAAAGGSLLIAGRARRTTWPALLVVLAVGFGTVCYDYYTFDVVIPSHRVLLQGEMIVPGRRAGVTYPAVLLAPDQGCQDRDETWGVNRPFREIAEHLALNRYIVLRYDKRGCGRSGGEFTQSGLDDFARDVASAGTYLAERKEVGNQPLFAVGHGFGGQAITIAASAQPDLFAGLVLLATPASQIADWLRAQHRYTLTMSGASPEQVDARLAAVDDWIEGVRSRRYLNYGDYFGTRGISEDLQAEQRTTPLPPVWLRQALDHNQPATLATIPSRVLILAGEADWRVPPWEAETLAEALKTAGRSDWELRQLPAVNHQLVAVDSVEQGFLLEQSDVYLDIKRPVASAVLKALTDWLDRKE